MAALLALGAVATAPRPALAQDPSQPRLEIPGDAMDDSAEFIGSPAKRDPIRMRRRVPEHPFMAPNGRSNLHVDPFQSDLHITAGPLGRSPEVRSTLFFRECASVAFDSRGRLITICVGLDRPVLAMLDPVTLNTLAAFPLPPRQASGDNPFTDFSGGGYFYLDHRDRAVIPTTDRRLFVVAPTDGPGFRLAREIDLGGAVAPGDKVISALPDWKGRIWFASVDGVLGWVDEDGRLHAIEVGERISNSFAVGQGGGVFVVSDAAMYRFEASGGTPQVIWRRRYRNTGEQKSGQTSPGSGTTPTLIHNRYVAITDNADPINVLVYERRRRVRGPRLVCRQAVLQKGTGSTDQSLVGFKHSIIVENNFGYEGPASTEMGGSTEPGLERVVFRRRHAQMRRRPERNCWVKWRSDEIAPSVVPKVSLKAGLLYTYTKPETDDGSDPWYLTAIDFRSGETMYKRLTGAGLGYNNNYAPVTIGPDGAAYVGVLGGLVRVADG